MRVTQLRAGARSRLTGLRTRVPSLVRGTDPAAAQRQGLTPPLGPAWLTIVLWLVFVAVIAALVVWVLAWLLSVPTHVSVNSETPIADRKALGDVFKVALAVAAGTGAVVALALNYRRHRLEESQSHRDDQRLFTDRFQSAADQLGHERPAVRLAGVHALARLADDWDAQRQMCIDVLCAYLRLPATTGLATSPGDTDPDTAGADCPKAPATTSAEEREIRQTIVRLITAHLQPITAEAAPPVSWQGNSFDFTGVTFDAGRYDFRGAQFSGGSVDFSRAQFSGATLDFSEAQFSGATVNFSEAQFSSGIAEFFWTRFSGGTIDFSVAEFSGATVHFSQARFSGGTVHFDGAEFSGGTVRFNGAEFSGATVRFDGAEFSGGSIDFSGAQFSGATVTLRAATFSGGTVDFHRVAEWTHPPVFDAWEAPPDGLLLPSAAKEGPAAAG